MSHSQTDEKGFKSIKNSKVIENIYSFFYLYEGLKIKAINKKVVSDIMEFYDDFFKNKEKIKNIISSSSQEPMESFDYSMQTNLFLNTEEKDEKKKQEGKIRKEAFFYYLLKKKDSEGEEDLSFTYPISQFQRIQETTQIEFIMEQLKLIKNFENFKSLRLSIGGITADIYSLYKKEQFVESFDNLFELNIQLKDFKLWDLMLKGAGSKKLIHLKLVNEGSDLISEEKNILNANLKRIIEKSPNLKKLSLENFYLSNETLTTLTENMERKKMFELLSLISCDLKEISWNVLDKLFPTNFINCKGELIVKDLELLELQDNFLKRMIDIYIENKNNLQIKLLKGKIKSGEEILENTFTFYNQLILGNADKLRTGKGLDFKELKDLFYSDGDIEFNVSEEGKKITIEFNKFKPTPTYFGLANPSFAYSKIILNCNNEEETKKIFENISAFNTENIEINFKNDNYDFFRDLPKEGKNEKVTSLAIDCQNETSWMDFLRILAVVTKFTNANEIIFRRFILNDEEIIKDLEDEVEGEFKDPEYNEERDYDEEEEKKHEAFMKEHDEAMKQIQSLKNTKLKQILFDNPETYWNSDRNGHGGEGPDLDMFMRDLSDFINGGIFEEKKIKISYTFEL